MPHSFLFSLNIARFNGIDYTIIIILELDSPILIRGLGFAFLIIFLGGGGLPIFINVGTELPHRRRLTIPRRLIRRVTKVLFKIIPAIYGLTRVTLFRDLGIAVEDVIFL